MKKINKIAKKAIALAAAAVLSLETFSQVSAENKYNTPLKSHGVLTLKNDGSDSYYKLTGEDLARMYNLDFTTPLISGQYNNSGKTGNYALGSFRKADSGQEAAFYANDVATVYNKVRNGQELSKTDFKSKGTITLNNDTDNNGAADAGAGEIVLSRDDLLTLYDQLYKVLDSPNKIDGKHWGHPGSAAGSFQTPYYKFEHSWKDLKECENCDGDGKVDTYHSNCPRTVTGTCSTCSGRGYVSSSPQNYSTWWRMDRCDSIGDGKYRVYYTFYASPTRCGDSNGTYLPYDAESVHAMWSGDRGYVSEVWDEARVKANCEMCGLPFPSLAGGTHCQGDYIPRPLTCPKCNGDGRETKTCPKCNGDGYYWTYNDKTCGTCHGSGNITSNGTTTYYGYSRYSGTDNTYYHNPYSSDALKGTWYVLR